MTELYETIKKLSKEIVTEDNNKIIKQMVKYPFVIDDSTKTGKQILGLVEFNNPGFGLAVIPKSNKTYALNNAYVGRDGNLHWSTRSIGGCLEGIPTHDAINKYNICMPFEDRHIKRIYWFDGTTLTA